MDTECMQNWVIREATKEDAGQIQSIYEPYVQNTAITFEYDVPTVEEMSHRIENTLKKYPYFVATDAEGKIVGYAYAGCFKDRAAYDWSVELSIYVDGDFRGKSIGTLLYDRLEERLKEMGIKNLYACIAYTEIEDEYLTNYSCHFHEKRGFHYAGKFLHCGLKFDKWYDMVWMEKFI